MVLSQSIDVIYIGRILFEGLVSNADLFGIVVGVAETTKLTQELAVKLEQGRDLRQWHSMAN